MLTQSGSSQARLLLSPATVLPCLEGFSRRFISAPGILFFVFLIPLMGGCKAKDTAQTMMPEVAVVTLQSEKVSITNELPGRTSAFLIAEIRPQVNGIIQKRLFVEGSDVKTGQVLYQIDPAPFQAALDRAESHLPSLRRRVDRYKKALAEQAVSQQDLDDATAALKQAEAELKAARINLDYTRVISRFPVASELRASPKALL